MIGKIRLDQYVHTVLIGSLLSIHLSYVFLYPFPIVQNNVIENS